MDQTVFDCFHPERSIRLVTLQAKHFPPVRPVKILDIQSTNDKSTTHDSSIRFPFVRSSVRLPLDVDKSSSCPCIPSQEELRIKSSSREQTFKFTNYLPWGEAYVSCFKMSKQETLDSAFDQRISHRASIHPSSFTSKQASMVQVHGQPKKGA